MRAGFSAEGEDHGQVTGGYIFYCREKPKYVLLNAFRDKTRFLRSKETTRQEGKYTFSAGLALFPKRPYEIPPFIILRISFENY